MNNELGKIRKEVSESNLRHYPGFCLEGLKKTTNRHKKSIVRAEIRAIQLSNVSPHNKLLVEEKKRKESRTTERKIMSKYSTYSNIRVLRMVAYLLKARNVESEKQQLLCNDCVTRNH